MPRLGARVSSLLRRAVLLAAAVCVCAWASQRASAFQAVIELTPGERRCLGEQLSKHVLVVGEFHITYPLAASAQGGGMLVVAHDPVNSTPIFKQQGKDHVRTAFTTALTGTHTFCVSNTGKLRLVVDAQMIWGPEARDYSQIAKAEHLDEVMVQLLRLQDRLKLYHANVLYMREKESKMRAASDGTASRLMTFCIVNMLLLVLAALASAYYFKRFFRSKKII
ncbi:hypothetical protein BESB_020260 [Besnoitia besnoiti]|uniref:GOLD domain-containing protein n=1 Tax=Besnoitia besnoiti TaxID=94643 RepID=A0A2A9M270_BESBE|nr:hypothetical protein BESB_020260 [Besnoitia besnoiti]PFH32085.1 hypothetical protein BESB_020260 [Besnoitia besnoiti]